MSNNWKEIWNKKEVVSLDFEDDEFLRFCELKKANGFDVAVEDENAYFNAFYRGWIEFYEKLTELTGGNISSVYEVGCGSGVNLFMIKNRLPNVAMGGCDYSESMVKSVRLTIGGDDFICCGGDEINIVPKYDVVMAESVFQYFESEEYAGRVLRKMIEKSNILTYLGEIHDKIYEEELMEYRRKTIANYDEKYKGLHKLFLRREWIEDIAQDYGKGVIYTSINNPEYLNGQYEFNCFIVNK